MTAKEKTAKVKRDERTGSAAALSDKDLDAIHGGGTLSSAVSNVVKNFGQALQTAARG